MELVDGDRIEARGWLVEQQDRRVAQQGERDRRLLAHPLGIGLHPPGACLARQRHLVERRIHRGPVHLAPGKVEEIAEVLVGIEMAVERGCLGQVGNLRARRFDIACDRLPVDQRFAAGRDEETEKGQQGRGLARAVAAEQRIDLAPGDREGHIVEHHGAVTHQRERAGFERWCHGNTRPEGQKAKLAVTRALRGMPGWTQSCEKELANQRVSNRLSMSKRRRTPSVSSASAKMRARV